MTLTNGSYKATVTRVEDNGYGDVGYRVKVLCFTGTHAEGDVRFLKTFDSESAATRAARRELAKAAA